MPKYQITIPGYEYNPNGADFYPDAYEEFEGTQQEVLTYIAKKEAEFQTKRALWQRNPFHNYTNAVSTGVWDRLPTGEKPGDCEWCRAVVEVRELKGFDLGACVQAAKQVVEEQAQKLIEAAKVQMAKEVRKVHEQTEVREREEFQRLSRKFGGQ